MVGISEGSGQAGVIVLQQLTALGGGDASFGNNGRYQVPETLAQTLNWADRTRFSQPTEGAPTDVLLSRSRILLGMTSLRTNAEQWNMLTLTLQGGTLFSNGFE